MAVKSIVKVSELEGRGRIDPEYYHPKYYSAIESVLSFGQTSQLREIAKIIRGRNPSKYTDTGVPVVRAIDLRDITNWEDVLSASSSERLFCLKQGDILISSIGAGSIGKVELFLDTRKATTVSEVSVIRASNYSPAAIATFLRTKYGYLQLERRITGSTGQLHLYPRDIGTVLVPLLNSGIQSELEAMLSESQKVLAESKQLYLQAKQILLDELRWDKLDLSQSNSYTIPLSQAKDVSRVDAEHFQPKYEKLLSHIRRMGETDILGDVVLFNKRGFQPTYVEGGNVIVVNSQHLGRYLLNVEATERTDEDFWRNNKRCQLETNDVLIYSTGAYVGRTNVWLEDSKAIASNHVNIIRPSKEYNPLYLSVYLNSLPGLWQAEMWASGSGQRELYPEDIARFVLYQAPKQLQEEIAGLVLQSYQARKEAKVLLEEAKRKVEELIEKGGA